MADATSLLVDQLINALTTNLSEGGLERCKRSALRTLADSHSARVNQFEITARLEGLEEKWRILNNDPLAEALRLRRAELSVTSNKWAPEILSLLLQLSDRPSNRSNIVNAVLPKLEPPSASLTWADIVAEDPLDDRDGIWKNVDFTANDSDDERSDSLQSHVSVPTPESTANGQSVEACIETLIEPATSISLWEIRNAQTWDTQDADKLDEDRSPNMKLTELQAGREVIFLLLGLPTSIFSQENDGQITVSKAVFLEHASQESLTGLLQEFAVVADKLLSIRRWAEKDERIPLEQTFQAALASRLESFDRALSTIQTRILSRDAQPVSSLLELYNETSNISRLLLQTHEVLLELDVDSKLGRPFRILECLFDRTCVNQAIGDTEGYEYMANLFFECFQTYLKPIRLWMEQGQLTGRDGVIFIQRDERDVHLNSVWRSQYHLIKDSNGDLHAPKFLHVVARKIFNTGKSVDFLKRLKDHDLIRDPAKEVVMNYESVCQPAHLGLFSPFPELFDAALDRWIADKHQASSSELRAQLESNCGLRSSLDALECIYFASGDTNINDGIFEKVDRGNPRWKDGLTMDELFQGSLSSIPFDRLKICPGPATQQETRGARRSMNVLEDIWVSYSLPWPVANVIRTDSIEVYQRVFSFLIQVRRAKYLLQRRKIVNGVRATAKKLPLQLYALRHRLLWLTNTILTYIADMVLSVATADMRIAMDRAQDVDTMIAVHQAYITKLEDQCLLIKKHTSTRQAIISLLDLTILFSDMQASYAGNTFTDTKASQKHAAHSNNKDSDSDSDVSSPFSALHAELSDEGRLKHMLDTFRNLHSFVTAAVRAISKNDNALCWEVLANNLAMGLEK